jgi:hypothetical protein
VSLLFCDPMPPFCDRGPDSLVSPSNFIARFRNGGNSMALEVGREETLAIGEIESSAAFDGRVIP